MPQDEDGSLLTREQGERFRQLRAELNHDKWPICSVVGVVA
jgi:hypothetical protein